tara:strand:+ start:1009 stop:1533 length:525 start_codon:yes stop_codon:yes gene_type:complete
MSFPKDLLIIAASNGENLSLAKRFIKLGNELKINAELIDLTMVDLPLFNPRNPKDAEIKSVSESLHNKMSSAKRWVICAPEYNGSIPPLLSNTIAWLSVQEKDFRRLFNGRPIALASVSGGGCMELLVSMRIQLSHLGAQVLGRQLASNKNNPAKDESIKKILLLLSQMEQLKN